MAEQGKAEEGKKDPPKSEIVGIRLQVAERIAQSNPEVRESVVEVLSQKEIKRRQDAILKGFELRDQYEKDLRKIKPDNQMFDNEGNVLTEGFSKAKYEEKKKLVEKKEKLDKALEQALSPDKPDYAKLFEIASSAKPSEDTSI